MRRHGGIFHGGESADDRHKQELLEYLRRISREVRMYLGAADPPLVLGGVGYMTAIYRQVSSHRTIIEKEVSGSLDHLDWDELHRRSWNAVEPYFARSGRDELQKLHRLIGTGLASIDVNEVLNAARHGRIESLFLAGNEVEKQDIENEVAADALANLAAIETLTAGGHVFSLAPGSIQPNVPMAAVFRY